MKNPLGVSPSKGYRGRKILMTSVGIEPTTSGLDRPLLCRLNEVGQRKSGTIKVVNRGEEKVRVNGTFREKNVKFKAMFYTFEVLNRLVRRVRGLSDSFSWPNNNIKKSSTVAGQISLFNGCSENLFMQNRPRKKLLPRTEHLSQTRYHYWKT